MSDTIKVLPPRARKPSLKRRLPDQSDEDEATPPKRSGTGTKAKRLRTHSEEATTPVDGSLDDTDSLAILSPKEDMDVDIEGDMPSASRHTELSALSTTTPSSSRTTEITTDSSNSITRVKRKATKRAVMSSDEGSADEYDASNDNTTTEKDKEDDLDWDAPPKTKTKTKEKEKELTSAGGIVVKGKGILSTKIPKKRTTKDNKPLIVNFRDESKSNSSALASPSTDSADVPSKSSDSAKPSAASTKRKLPTIQKKKTPAEATSQPAHGDANIFGFDGFKAKRFCQKQGHADVDLSNSSLYAELFKGPSSTKATNTRIEARRKELNRMRDEARAKRQASLANPFDLQASLEKIARFEDRWRVANRPIYYPSCLAGALFERRPPPVEGAPS